MSDNDRFRTRPKLTRGDDEMSTDAKGATGFTLPIGTKSDHPARQLPPEKTPADDVQVLQMNLKSHPAQQNKNLLLSMGYTGDSKTKRDDSQ
jgi:hypothetical protein